MTGISTATVWTVSNPVQCGLLGKDTRAALEGGSPLSFLPLSIRDSVFYAALLGEVALEKAKIMRILRQ